MTLATSAAETITNAHHTADFEYLGGTPVTFGSNVIRNAAGGVADARDPYNGFIEAAVTENQIVIDQMTAIITAGGQPPPFHFFMEYMFEVFNDNPADYSFSNAPISVDLIPPQGGDVIGHGGFAEGDVLVDISEMIGSSFNDVIRGSNPSDFPADSDSKVVGGNNTQAFLHFTINNPGNNVLVGGGGSDVLEGRGGADILMGGSFTADFAFDYASYESSSAAVTVRLAGVGSDTQTAIATGGDAQGDILVGIEGLIGSAFSDHLTGNSLNNILIGGLGDDTLDGKSGTDTVDYSTDHISPFGAADAVVVNLGLNGASGSGAEFKPSHLVLVQVSTDTLISIENVIGTDGADTLIGNEQANTFDGRSGSDVLDGGLGNDTLIGGGGGFDIATYVSHDGLSSLLGEVDTISLGLNGADGSYTRGGIFSNFGHPQFQIVESDVLRGIGGITGSSHSETINGNEQSNLLEGRGGDDHINGGAGGDVYVFGTTAFGNDVLFDESGTDGVLVNSFSDVKSALRDGNDLVVTLGTGKFLTTGTFRVVDHFAGHPIENITDANNNTMVLSTSKTGGILPGIIAGGNGSDTLDGRGGDDFLFGGNGSDRLIGGDGNDRLTGDNGGDTFVFGPGFGNDVVTDFSHADKIEFDGVFESFEAVQAATTQVGDDTVITLDADNSITLQGVAADSLHASHFILV